MHVGPHKPHPFLPSQTEPWELLCIRTEKDASKYDIVDWQGFFYVWSGHYFSENWKFLGTGNQTSFLVKDTFPDIWNEPTLALKGYVRDLDHGTIRLWAGRPVIECWKPARDVVQRIWEYEQYKQSKGL